jgi:hypothetical protein
LIREDVFYVEFVPRNHKMVQKGVLVPRVEAQSNTSTVTLRVVRGDEKGNLTSETVKYGYQSQGTQTRERLRCQGPATYTRDRHGLSSERAPQKKKTVIVKQ